MTSRVVFHLPDRFTHNYRDQSHLSLFKRIDDLITSQQGKVDVRARHEDLRDPHRTTWSDVLEPDNLHIIENGVVQQTGVLNTTLAYFEAFYHLDPMGVLANSSARLQPNDMSGVDEGDAQAFWDGLQAKFVARRFSRYSQPEGVAKIPAGCIAVFLQGDVPTKRGTAHCDVETLLRTVAKHADGCPVVVKAHPVGNIAKDTAIIAQLLSEGISLIPTDANIHDILRNCVATVSFNSAVALEGFLYRKPAILFGKSDFHHICETVCTPDQFPDAFYRARNTPQDYQGFLYWYFSTFCLSVNDTNLTERIFDIFARQGFNAERLGLTTLPRSFALRSADRWLASTYMKDYLNSRPEVQSVTAIKPLKVTQSSWVFEAQINGNTVAIKRYFDGDLAQRVHDMKGELDAIAPLLGTGAYQVNRCLMAWPHDGVVILSHAPGERLDRAIAARSGKDRAALFAHAGRWLAAYTASRERHTTFGPLYWVKRLRSKPTTHITSHLDKNLIIRLIDTLRDKVPNVRGAAVRQAASHGDFAGINAIFDGKTIYGVDIQGECWIAVAREVARFLVWQQLHDPLQEPDRCHGLNRADIDAMRQSGVLDDGEITTTLPFFIGEQLCARFIEDYKHEEVSNRARTAIKAYLEQTKSGFEDPSGW